MFYFLETANINEKEEKYKISFTQILRLNYPEWRYLIVGVIAAAILGASFPLWAILFGDFFGVILLIFKHFLNG